MKKVLVAALAAFSAVTIVAGEKTSAIVRMLNSRASGSVRTFVEASKTVAAEAAAGKTVQQYLIAVFCDDPDFPESLRPDEETRKRYLEESRAKLEDMARRRDNAMIWYLLSLEKNDLKLLERAAAGGNQQALNAWGIFVLTKAMNDPELSSEDRARRMEESFGCFRKAADKDDANGCYNLGTCYLRGYGTGRDDSLAFEYFRRAAEMGHPEAINNMGGLCRDGIGVKKDVAEATNWFKLSADLGNMYGELNYALALLRGEGVEKNEELGAKKLKALADRNSPEAMNAYAMCLYNGTGTILDRRAAVLLYRRAASQGFPPAMDNLASCYELGEGVGQNMKLSTVWKVRARAARGDRNAAAWLMKNGHSLR
jgi:TPR repeat protein